MDRNELRDVISRIAMSWVHYSADEVGTSDGDWVMAYSETAMEGNCPYMADEIIDYMAYHGALPREYVSEFMEEQIKEGKKPRLPEWPRGWRSST